MSQLSFLPTSSSHSPVITLHNGKPTTTSLNVAEVFGKRHDHIVRDIRLLSDNVPESFYAPNFGEVDYADAKGEKRPMYTMTRDGLTLLVMGYTGKRAMQFKLAYIEAFNRMEAQLSEKKDTPSLSTAADRSPLTKLVKVWCAVSRMPHAQAWAQVNAHFNINSISALPLSALPEACHFVQSRIDFPPSLEQPALPVNPLAGCDEILRRMHDNMRAVQEGFINLHRLYKDSVVASGAIRYDAHTRPMALAALETLDPLFYSAEYTMKTMEKMADLMAAAMKR